MQERVEAFRGAQWVLLLAHGSLYTRLVLEFVQGERILGNFLVHFSAGPC